MTSVNDMSYFIVNVDEDNQYSYLFADPRCTLQNWVTYGGGGSSTKKLWSIVMRWNRLYKWTVRNSSREFRCMLCSCPSFVVAFLERLVLWVSVYCVGQNVTTASTKREMQNWFLDNVRLKFVVNLAPTWGEALRLWPITRFGVTLHLTECLQIQFRR